MYTTMMLVVPWRSLATAASVAAAVAVGSRLDCNPTVFFYDSIIMRGGDSGKKQAYYSDKRIWIIGASSGIGREMALQLAGGGGRTFIATVSPPPRVVILSGRNVKQLETVAKQCREIQEQNLSTTTIKTRTAFCVVPLDVTNYEHMNHVVCQQVPAMLQEAVLDSGVDEDDDDVNNGEKPVDTQQQDSPSSSSACCLLDIIVLNSGAGHLSPALQTSPEVIEKVMQTNAIWPMIFMPLLLQNESATTTAAAAFSSESSGTTTRKTTTKTPHFIIMSSIAADLRAVPLSAAYAASKAALTTYFCSLSAERPDLALDVCLPGPVDTDFHCHHIGGGSGGGGNDTTTRHHNTATNSDKSKSSLSSSSSSSSSPLKMSVQRCAQLVLSAASMRQYSMWSSSSYRHIWIASQPVISVLYLHQWMPSLLLNKVFCRMGPKRIAMWEAGLDLYDPQSWWMVDSAAAAAAAATKTNKEKRPSAKD